MSNIFANMKTDGIEVQDERLGGFARKPTNLYPAKIKVAYLDQSPGGTHSLNVIFDIGGQEYREPAVYFTNKKGEHFFYAKDANGNPDTSKPKQMLPGFVFVNSLCLLATGQEFAELSDTIEEKTLKVWDSEEKKEVNKAKQVVTGLTGAEVLLAIVEQTVNKTEKNDQTGDYDPIAEDRDENVIEHVFHLETKASYSEMTKAIKAEKEGKELPAFIFADTWLEKNEGKKRDKRTIKDGATSAPKSGRPSSASTPAAGSTKAATSSLFNKNK